MKIIHLIIAAICLTSCNTQNSKEESASESINIDLKECKNSELENFISKIEIIPLETNDNSIFASFNKIAYYKEIESYLIVDKNQVVYLFSKNGKFVSNSKSIIGESHEEYKIAVDAIYNPYSKQIEILDPYGKIYCYDMQFNFKEKKTLKEEKQVFTRFFPLNKDEYILTPIIVSPNDASIFFCDYKYNKIESIQKYTNDFISTLTMNYNPFFTVDNQLYFSPLCLNYNIYKINIKEQKINPALNYNFGDMTIDINGLQDKFADTSSNTSDEAHTQKDLEISNQINSYLLKSNYPIPVVKLTNKKYIYLYTIQKGQRATYIYRKDKKQLIYQSSSQSEKTMNFCLELQDNVLTSLVQPYEIKQFIDEELLSKEARNQLKIINDEDNPIIVNYFLK